MTWASVLNAAVDGLLYATAGTLVAWVAGRRLLRVPWRELVALWRHHDATQAALLEAHEDQARHLATIAARLDRPQREET